MRVTSKAQSTFCGRRTPESAPAPSISWAIGLYRRQRGEELDGYIDVENIEATISPLLVKGKKPHLKQEIVSLVVAESKHLRRIDLDNLGNRVDAVMLR